MPKNLTTGHRKLILAELNKIVHNDFDCDGTGSTFCPGCVAIRAIHALRDVYEEIDEIDHNLEVDEAESNIVPPLIAQDEPPVAPSLYSVGELDEIAERILDGQKGDGDTSVPEISVRH